jgi:hypothetical protein
MDQLKTEMSHHEEDIESSVLLKKHSHKAFKGVVTVNCLKVWHEKPIHKKEIPCGFYGLKDHHIGDCGSKKEMRSIVGVTKIDELVTELYQQIAPRFLLVCSIPSGHHMFQKYQRIQTTFAFMAMHCQK